MDKPHRVGIAGYGVVGKRRQYYLNACEELKVVAVCDQVFDGSGQLDDGVNYYSNYKQLLEEDLDMLFVCMTNLVAPEVTIAGLEAGLHVFCEKPPGRNVEDIQQVIECERRSPGLILKYGFNHRYHESVHDALQIIQSGELGKVINLRGIYGKSKMITFGQNTDWRVSRELAGGGILLDQGIHMVDLLRLFAGEEFTKIHSFISNDFWHHDVEDNAYALMQTQSGQIAMLLSSATQWRHRFQLDIALERGELKLGGILSGSRSYGAETLTVVWASEDERGDPREQTTRYVNDPSWEDEIAEFSDAVIKGIPLRNGTASEALATMKLVYQIYCADPEWKEKWALENPI
jgi:predicted dehydrogenase